MTGSTRHRFAGATTVAALAILAAAAVGQPASATYPAAANGRIIFGVRTPDGQANLYSATPDGTDMQQLTNAKGFNACPAASTDGSQVAFCSDQTGNLENLDDGCRRQQPAPGHPYGWAGVLPGYLARWHEAGVRGHHRY